MNTRSFNFARWGCVCAYAVAMAWLESAVVFYLRTMTDRIEPYQANPLPFIGALGPVELVREAATLFMLLAVGLLAGRSWRARLGYAAVAFGVWDIFYYLFLKAICGWPHSLLNWDILFLLPVPWWGPVLAPASIALLMIVWGSLASRENPSGTTTLDTAAWPPRWRAWGPWALNGLGVALALYVFMLDTLAAAGGGVEAIRKVLPRHFAWGPFLLALLLMSAPIFPLCRRGDGGAASEEPGGNDQAARWGGDCGPALD